MSYAELSNKHGDLHRLMARTVGICDMQLHPVHVPDQPLDEAIGWLAKPDPNLMKDAGQLIFGTSHHTLSWSECRELTSKISKGESKLSQAEPAPVAAECPPSLDPLEVLENASAAVVRARQFQGEVQDTIGLGTHDEGLVAVGTSIRQQLVDTMGQIAHLLSRMDNGSRQKELASRLVSELERLTIDIGENLRNVRSQD